MASTWRYIPTKEIIDGEETWTIRELYSINGKSAWTSPISPFGNCFDELRNDLSNMTSDAQTAWLDLTGPEPVIREIGTDD